MQASVLFKEVFSKENLRQLYGEKILHSTSVGLDKITHDKFKRNIESEIELIIRKVQANTYTFTSYRQILEHKGPGQAPRTLCIPTIRDRLTLKALSEILEGAFQEAYLTPVPQAIITRLISDLNSKKYSGYIKLDLKDFYGSIDHESMLKCLRAKIRKKQILDLTINAIETPASTFTCRAKTRNHKGLPQGISISNGLANIYANKLDKFIKGLEPTIAYYRYVDDILILCEQNRITWLLAKIEKQINKMSLTLNEQKTKSGPLLNSEICFLGYVISNDLVTVQSSSKRKIERSLERHVAAIAKSKNEKRLQQQTHLKKQLSNRITGCFVSNNGRNYQRYGWLFYFSRITDVSYLAQLDRLVEKLFYRQGLIKPNDLPRFKKAYYQIRYNLKSSNYLPRFNFSSSTEEKRSALFSYFLSDEALNDLSDEQIEELFKHEVNRLLNELERDVGSFS